MIEVWDSSANLSKYGVHLSVDSFAMARKFSNVPCQQLGETNHLRGKPHVRHVRFRIIRIFPLMVINVTALEFSVMVINGY